MNVPQRSGQASLGDTRSGWGAMATGGGKMHGVKVAVTVSRAIHNGCTGEVAEVRPLEGPSLDSILASQHKPWQSFWLLALIALSFCPNLLAAATFPPERNAAWVYDPPTKHEERKAIVPGYFAESIKRYNKRAKKGARIGELYVYGGDMEMYCPDHDDSECSPRNFHVFYSSAARHGKSNAGSTGNDKNQSVQAYARIFRQGTRRNGNRMEIVPIIDGVISGRGALHGFNNLSRVQSGAFADKVASQICADSVVDGVQFDLEPFNVSRKAGQYYFYRRIGRDFASRKFGCVDATHPHGRFFSIFTVANRIRPHTAGAKHVSQIMHTAENGYLIDALYDLEGTPPGHRTSVAAYRRLVMKEVRHMREWASFIDVKYQFGVPAAASAHEFSTCAGPRCQSSPAMKNEGSGRNGQLAYVEAALAAIEVGHRKEARGYLGVALWAWSAGLPYRGMQFSPNSPPTKVQQYLAHGLAESG